MIRYHNKYKLSFVVLLLLIFSEIFSDFFPQIRWLKYLALPALLIIGILSRFEINVKNKFLNNQLILSSVLVILGISFSLFRGNISIRAFEESFFILVPVFIIFLLSKKKIMNIQNIKTLFFTYTFMYLLSIGDKLLELLKDPYLLIQGITTSNVPTESSYAFVLGFFVLFFLIKREYWFFIISFFIFILAFKRIAILGVLLIVGIYFLNYLIKIQYKKLIVPTAIFSLLGVVFLYVIGVGIFDNEIYNFTGVSANSLLMGRQNLYQTAFDNFPLYDSLIGNGIGSLTNFFTNIPLKYKDAIGDNLLLHSDLLKIIIEVGLVFFIFWIFIKAKISIFSLESFYIFAYFIFLLLTDNVLIYFNVLVVYYFIQSTLQLEQTVESTNHS